MAKPKDYSYYKARIERGYYPSVRIFKQSLGRSLLSTRTKNKLIEFAENNLVDSVPGRPRARPIETVEITSLVPMTMPEAPGTEDQSDEPDESNGSQLGALEGAKSISRANRLTLLIQILSSPARRDFLTLIEEGVTDGLVHQDLHDTVHIVIRLLEGHK